jgi:hypothetical protein
MKICLFEEIEIDIKINLSPNNFRVDFYTFKIGGTNKTCFFRQYLLVFYFSNILVKNF